MRAVSSLVIAAAYLRGNDSQPKFAGASGPMVQLLVQLPTAMPGDAIVGFMDRYAVSITGYWRNEIVTVRPLCEKVSLPSRASQPIAAKVRSAGALTDFLMAA